MADLHADAKAIAEQLGHELGITDTKKPVPWSIFAAIAGGLKAAALEQQRRIEALESKLAEIESKGVEYRGVWNKSESYRTGTIVTHGGSAWHAASASQDAEPGKSNAWKLMVKRGADARGAR